MYICMHLLIYFTDLFLDFTLGLFVHLFFPSDGESYPFGKSYSYTS